MTDSTNGFLDAYPDAGSEPNYTCPECGKKCHYLINNICKRCFDK